MGDNHRVAHAEDGELVRRSRRGDRAAFGELVRRYRRAAYAVALSVTRAHEDAEDAAQEAFLVALDRLEDCRDPERFSAWFLTIVRNRSRNLIRREQLRDGEPMPFSVESPDPGPVLRLERAELRRALMEAVERLSDAQREVLLLHDLEGWKHREIAARLEMPAGTVRSHLHYARKRLRRLLSGQESHFMEQSAG
jgi:RNA polymerase sigma-70 factor, ECF subfamily